MDKAAKHEKYARFMRKIATGNIKTLLAEETDRISTKRTQTRVPDQTEEASFKMLLLGNSDVWNVIDTALFLFLETVVIELLHRRFANDGTLRWFEGWPKSYCDMQAIAIEVVSRRLFVLLTPLHRARGRNHKRVLLDASLCWNEENGLDRRTSASTTIVCACNEKLWKRVQAPTLRKLKSFAKTVALCVGPSSRKPLRFRPR